MHATFSGILSFRRGTLRQVGREDRKVTSAFCLVNYELRFPRHFYFPGAPLRNPSFHMKHGRLDAIESGSSSRGPCARKERNFSEIAESIKIVFVTKASKNRRRRRREWVCRQSIRTL